MLLYGGAFCGMTMNAPRSTQMFPTIATLSAVSSPVQPNLVH